MNRATFLKRSALLAAGVVALGNEELLERLSWEPKRLWTGADLPKKWVGQAHYFDFAPGDHVALVRSGSLVEFARVTSVSPLTINWASNPFALGDLIVHAGPVPMS